MACCWSLKNPMVTEALILSSFFFCAFFCCTVSASFISPLKKPTKTKTKEVASKAEFGSPNHTILENHFACSAQPCACRMGLSSCACLSSQLTVPTEVLEALQHGCLLARPALIVCRLPNNQQMVAALR